MLTKWIDDAIESVTALFPTYSFFSFDFQVRSLLAVILVSLACGLLGSLVVGNRLAFFSDALAHCAFAGVALGFLLALAAGVRGREEFALWIKPVLVGFGVLIGLGIAWVRERSGLSSDTVIGIFFAGAVGFGAILLRFVSVKGFFDPENFLFGDPLTVTSADLLHLLLLLVLLVGVLGFLHNQLVLASFNRSLALSRRIPVRLCNLILIVLLALVVNVCLQTVGVLQINAMLVVPAATAANVCRNLRRMFWTTVAICLFVGLAGQAISWNVAVAQSQSREQAVTFGVGGIMVVLSVVLFFGSLLFRRQPT